MTFSKERICNLIVQSSEPDEILLGEYSPLFQVLNKYSQSIFLYGEGGKGKSTAAQYLLLELYKEKREGYYLPLKLLKPMDGDNAIHNLFKSIYHKDIEDLYIVNKKPIIVLDGINEAPEEFKKHDYFINECQRLIERFQIIIIGRTNRVQTNSKETIKKEVKGKYEFDNSVMIYVEQQELPIEYVRENIDVAKLSIDVQKLLQNNYNFTLYIDLREYEPNLIISNAYELAKLYYNVAIKTKFIVVLNSDKKKLDIKEVYSWLKYFEYECATGRLSKKWDKYCLNNDKIDRRIKNAIRDINLAFKKLSQIAIKGSITANKINDYFGTYIEELNHLSLIEKRGGKYFFVNDKARDYFQTQEYYSWLNGISIQNVELRISKCLNLVDSLDISKNMYFEIFLKELDDVVRTYKDKISDRVLIYYHLIFAKNGINDDDFQWHTFYANDLIKKYDFEELILDQELLPIVFEIKCNVAYVAYFRGDVDWAIREYEYVENLLQYLNDSEDRTLIKIQVFEELKDVYYSIDNAEKEKEYLNKTLDSIYEYLKFSRNIRGKINQFTKLIEMYLNADKIENVEREINNGKIIELCHNLYSNDKRKFKEVYVHLLSTLCYFYLMKRQDCLSLIFQTFEIIFETNISMKENNTTDWILQEVETKKAFVLLYRDDLNKLSVCAKGCYILKSDREKVYEWDLIRVAINKIVYMSYQTTGRMGYIQSLEDAATSSDDLNISIELYETAFSLTNQNGTESQVAIKRRIATKLITAYYQRLSSSIDLIQYDICGTMEINTQEDFFIREKKKIDKVESEMWLFDKKYSYNKFKEAENYVNSCVNMLDCFQLETDIESHNVLKSCIFILFVVSKVWSKGLVKIIPNQDVKQILLLDSEIKSYNKEDFFNNLYKVYILLDECFRFVCTHSDEESKEFFVIISNLLQVLKRYKLKYYCLSAIDMKEYFKNKLEEKDCVNSNIITTIIKRIETIWQSSQII